MNKSFLKSVQFFVLAAIICSCAGGSDNKDEKQQKPAQEQVPQVKIETVYEQLIPQKEVYTGTVESDVKNNITPNAPYRIKKIYADVGDYVRRGQVLVVLDKSNLSQVNTQIQSQQLVIENARLQMENQKIEFGRMAELYNVGGISKSEYDAAKLMYDQTVIAHNNAKKQLEALEK